MTGEQNKVPARSKRNFRQRTNSKHNDLRARKDLVSSGNAKEFNMAEI